MPRMTGPKLAVRRGPVKPRRRSSSLPEAALAGGRELGGLLVDPGLVGLGCLDREEAAHAVVAEAAELGAGDLVLELGLAEALAHLVGRDRRREPERDRHAGH